MMLLCHRSALVCDVSSADIAAQMCGLIGMSGLQSVPSLAGADHPHAALARPRSRNNERIAGKKDRVVGGGGVRLACYWIILPITNDTRLEI
jgi:hypothetical protein